MRLHILAAGSLRSGPERDLIEDYVSRFERTGRQIGLRGLTEHEVTSGGGREAEAERLLARVPDGATIVALDERGKPLGSQAFAGWIERSRDDGLGDVAFLIGGAEGHGAAVLEAATMKLSFGVQTWPHRLVRVMLAEQLYRAAMILSGSPYHKA